jgi:hypothetical protein
VSRSKGSRLTRDAESGDNRNRTGKEAASVDVCKEGCLEKTPASINILSRERPPCIEGLRILWEEVRSLMWRIQLARKNNWYRCGISLEPASERRTLKSSLRRKYRRDRICGIRRLCSIHPVPSPSDFYILVRSIGPPLFQEVREKAEEDQLRIPRIATLGQHKQKNAAYSVSRLFIWARFIFNKYLVPAFPFVCPIVACVLQGLTPGQPRFPRTALGTQLPAAAL